MHNAKGGGRTARRQTLARLNPGRGIRRCDHRLRPIARERVRTIAPARAVHDDGGVMVVEAKHSHLPPLPVEGADKKMIRQADTAAAEKPRRGARTRVKARPGRPAYRLMRRPPPTAVDLVGVIVRNVDDLRVGRFKHQGLPLPHDVDRLIGLQIAGGPGALTKELRGVDDLFGFDQKRFAQICGPVAPLFQFRQVRV